MNKDQAEVLAEWIKAASSCVVFTGAGMSTESGLPDFRSQTGMWQGQDPTRLASTEVRRWRSYMAHLPPFVACAACGSMPAVGIWRKQVPTASVADFCDHR